MSALLLGLEESDIGAGPIGLVILLLMLIATFLLIRNMNSRIKRLPPRFPDQDPDQKPDPDGKPDPQD